MTQRPHDALFKAACGTPQLARPLLRAMLPQRVADEVDWASLQNRPASFVDAELEDSHADLLFSAFIGASPAFFYLLFEHQSTPDADLPFRIQRYMHRIWDRHRREHGGARLPLILPFVISQVEDGWSSPTHFHELVDIDLQEFPELRAHVPDFSVIIDDLSQVSDAQLRARSLELFTDLALRLMRDGRRGGPVLDDLSELALAFRRVYAAGNGIEAFSQLLRYFAQVVKDRERVVEFRATLREAVPEAKATMSTLAEIWQEEGEARGVKIGEARGVVKGALQGRRELVLQTLEDKFGPITDARRARIEAAEADELRGLMRRLLQSDSIDEVLGG